MLIGFQITGMIQAKLVLAKGVRSQQDQELMQFGTLKIMLAQQIHAEEGLDQVCLNSDFLAVWLIKCLWIEYFG